MKFLLALNQREKQIIEALSQGNLNTGTAHELNISEDTIKKHLKSMYKASCP
jgi:DNA-binding NarL/FixJ family response regulator